MDMDIHQDQLQVLAILHILKETRTIPTKSPKTFFLVTLTLILPLSLAIFANSIFAFPRFLVIDISSHPIKLLFLYELYHIILIALAILSTSAVVFISASIYTSKPVSFLLTMSALPNLSIRLFKTFLCISFILSVYNLLELLIFNLFKISDYTHDVYTILLTAFVIDFIGFVVLEIQVYITALCFMASAVSVLEPVNGFSAFKKSYQLLKGRIILVFCFLNLYVLLSCLLNVLSAAVVIGGGDSFSLGFRIVLGGLIVGLLMFLNLSGLVMVSVFYYVCKSYHCETIDKTVLFDHLGGYLGEYVPLMTSSNIPTIQMEVLNL